MNGCALNAEELPGRLEAWRALLSQATGSGEDGYRFPADPSFAAQLAELAAKETGCCSFFRFELTISAAELTLRIDASPPR